MTEKWYSCPKCGSPIIIRDEFQISNGTEVWRTCYCDQCGFTWNEVLGFHFNEDFTTGEILDEDGDILDN